MFRSKHIIGGNVRCFLFISSTNMDVIKAFLCIHQLLPPTKDPPFDTLTYRPYRKNNIRETSKILVCIHDESIILCD